MLEYFYIHYIHSYISPYYAVYFISFLEITQTTSNHEQIFFLFLRISCSGRNLRRDLKLLPGVWRRSGKSFKWARVHLLSISLSLSHSLFFLSLSLSLSFSEIGNLGKIIKKILMQFIEGKYSWADFSRRFLRSSFVVFDSFLSSNDHYTREAGS